MNIMIFDTETTSLTKCFTYNVGYVIYDTDSNSVLVERDYVIEQIWHNLPLFSTAYYAEKRPIYVNRMRSRKVIMKKFGQVTQQMIRDIENYNVEGAYAYNSPFDTKVFEFNCDWFKVVNPFDTIPIFDIRGYVHKFIAFTENYKAFCETNQLFTETGNYSTTAEAVYKYITNEIDFEEEHTALNDSRIELKILLDCLTKGGELNTEYTVYRTVPRKQLKTLNIYVNKELSYSIQYEKKTSKQDNIYLS